MRVFIITEKVRGGGVKIVGVRTTQEQAERRAAQLAVPCQVQEWQHDGDEPNRVYPTKPEGEGE